jgi:hypothetical protein
MSESEKVRTGACLCGKIKFKLEGESANPRWNVCDPFDQNSTYI